ncbi:Mth938-like domain-containing protein [Roseinatronobacter sp. NSM]|uniref:Mth938-like domain-containing protein n=1 Tax=Roseinatronobacter sp. NSM TaxID=3457785 RepID=UPI0040365140
MRLSEIDFGASRPIDGYGKTFFRIGGQVCTAPLLLVAGDVRSWGGYGDHAPLLELAGRVDVLFIGTGGTIAHIPAQLRETLEAAGLGVESMDSPAACRTYNVLLSEQRRVAVALMPVG